MLSHVVLLVIQLFLVVAKSQDCDTLAALYAPSLSPGAQIIVGEANKRWSVWEKPSFSITIKPVTEKDVQNIVSLSECLLITVTHKHQ
jgi:hypothetical protein